MKICVTGAVKAGKTFVANKLQQNDQGLPILCTDELIGKMDWSAESEEVAKWLDRPDSFILEGATVVRALRKWLASHPTGKPCDKVIYLRMPQVTIEKAQVSSSKAQMTIWSQITGELKHRGVEVVECDQYPLEAEVKP